MEVNMKYVVDDLDRETVLDALHAEGYGVDMVNDSQGLAYGTIWTERAFEGVNGQIGGFTVGHIARNQKTFPTFTLVLDEFHNDRKRMAGVLTRILNRTTMR
jgi:hypothetical protein